MNRPTLSICMIVKNEESNLPECLDYVKKFADEVIIVDTGSIDQTVPIAKEYGVKLFHYAWNHDFAEARNVSIGYTNCDWMLILDADERITADNAERIKDAICDTEIDAYLVKLSSIISKGKSVHEVKQITKSYRLFRNFKGISFSGQVHEEISESLTKINANTKLSDIVIDHLGYAKDENAFQRKQQRNLELLKLQIEKEPENWYALYNIGQAYMLSGLFSEARRYLLKAIRTDTNLHSHTPTIYTNIGECLFKEGDYDEAIAYCKKSICLEPDQIVGYLILSRIYFAKKEYNMAIGPLEKIIKMQKNDIPDGTAVEISLEKALLQYNLGHCFFKTEKFDNAIKCLKESIRLNKNYFERCIVMIVQSYINICDIDSAFKETELMVKTGTNNKVVSSFFNTIGNIWAKKHEYSKAVLAYQSSLKLIPDTKIEHLIHLMEKHIQLNNELNIID